MHHTMLHKPVITNIISSIFGLLFLAIAVLNMLYGNDFWFGVMIANLSLLYFPPIPEMIRKVTGFSVHWSVKLVIALFILWSAVGVGELFDKIEMMKSDI